MRLRTASYPERLFATPWLTLLGFLAISQTAHLLEHIAQMIQIHVLHLTGAAARGIVGQLDLDWVHLIWNLWVFVLLVVLVPRFRMNPWLLGVAVFAAWHLVEHVVMMATYLTTGVAGSPGLLSSGGLIAGGLPIPRPDLHFLYNFAETIALVIAWVAELRRTQPEGQISPLY